MKRRRLSSRLDQCGGIQRLFDSGILTISSVSQVPSADESIPCEWNSSAIEPIYIRS